MVLNSDDNAEWHHVLLDHQTYDRQTDSTYRRFQESQQKRWCEQEFGPPRGQAADGRWYAAWDGNKYRFSFCDQNDATLFALRWL